MLHRLASTSRLPAWLRAPPHRDDPGAGMPDADPGGGGGRRAQAQRGGDRDRRPDGHRHGLAAADAGADRAPGRLLQAVDRVRVALLPLARDLPDRPLRPQPPRAQYRAPFGGFGASQTIAVWLQKAGY